MKLNIHLITGKQANDNLTLADLGVGPNGTVQLELQSTDPVNTPIKTYRPKQEYHMPDVITVRIQGSEGKSDEKYLDFLKNISTKIFKLLTSNLELMQGDECTFYNMCKYLY
jgi:hypothetical protein